MMALAKRFVFRAEAPVRIALRKTAIRRDLVHLLVVAHLEDDRKKIEPIRARLLADLFLGRKQLFGEWSERMCGHGSSPWQINPQGGAKSREASARRAVRRSRDSGSHRARDDKRRSFVCADQRPTPTDRKSVV